MGVCDHATRYAIFLSSSFSSMHARLWVELDWRSQGSLNHDALASIDGIQCIALILTSGPGLAGTGLRKYLLREIIVHNELTLQWPIVSSFWAKYIIGQQDFLLLLLSFFHQR